MADGQAWDNLFNRWGWVGAEGYGFDSKRDRAHIHGAARVRRNWGAAKRKR